MKKVVVYSWLKGYGPIMTYVEPGRLPKPSRSRRRIAGEKPLDRYFTPLIGRFGSSSSRRQGATPTGVA